MTLSPANVVRLRVPIGEKIAIGPGKAALLDAIAETGSISAAGRRLSMSYRKAWLVVKDMNRFFKEPLVYASKGGPSGGGARLTDMGRLVLKKYRRLETIAWESISEGVNDFERLLNEPDAI
ncbi:MAG: winged helix-turn-helix domain-containing protein [Holophagales bacterium]|jgi:molybdate transport system regulatory protein|nr:winged helix-turn-helix domain-containing protein [Holophagales bacterium]